MTTMSGFSSRSTSTTITQLPQRDEASMSDHEPGFSNSTPADDEPSDVSAKVVNDGQVEDKAIKPDAATTKKRSSQKR